MEEVCDKLTNTYNASILDKENTLTQALFYHSSDTNSNGNKGNTILMNLILNYYANKRMRKNGTLQIYDKIGGPISLTLQWSEKYNMYVYIFGEYHSSKIDCDKTLKTMQTQNIGIEALRDGCGPKKVRNPKTKRCVSESGEIGKQIIEKSKQEQLGVNIKNNDNKTHYITVEDFLYELFRTTPAFIDFYLETPGYTGQDYKYGRHPWMYDKQRLSQLSTVFFDCLSAIRRKDNPICRNVRVHYLDIRKEEEMKDVNDVSHLRDVYHKIEHYPDYNKNVKMLKNDKRIVATIKKLVTKNTDEYKKFWEEQLLQSSIVKKELSRTTLPKFVVQDFLEKEIVYAAMQYREQFQYYLASFDSDKMDLKAVLDGIRFTVAVNSVVMDMYTITRMFKKFKNVKNQPERPRNIILYAGDAHSTKCRKFFKQLGFQTITETGGVAYDDYKNNNYHNNKPSYSNCVDISNFKQPFFSEYPPTK